MLHWHYRYGLINDVIRKLKTTFLLRQYSIKPTSKRKTNECTFCAGLGARRLGPGDADAILEGGGRARGSDILNIFDKYGICYKH